MNKMVHSIKGTSTQKLDATKLSERLSNIWASLGETAVFTIGIAKNGEVDIINVQTVFDKPKQPIAPDNQEMLESPPDVDYIG
jgi:hypothetical protein